MKRREFLIGSAGVAGAMIPGVGAAEVIPCPPPVIVAVGGTSTQSTCAPTNPGEAPAWFTAMAEKTWTTVAGNAGQRLYDVRATGIGGNPYAICTAWTGACVDQATGRYILPSNGGHGDYGGNEVYALNLRAATPAWARLNNPSSLSGRVDSPANGDLQYADGTKPAGHHWHKPVCDINGNIWFPMVDGVYASGAWTTHVWKFNLTTLTWTQYAKAFPTIGGNAGFEASPAAYDKVKNQVWGIVKAGYPANNAGYWRIDPATGATTQIIANDYAASANGGKTWAAVAHDLGYLFYGTYNTDRLLILDVNNPTTPVNVAKTGTVPGNGHGCVYHQASRAFFLWHGNGANIIKIAIPADPVNGTWAISSVAPAASNTVTPSAPPEQGTFSKFNIVEDMGNGQSALVLLNAIDQPTYVYKLPLGGV
jgi:hypothetical protein